MWSAWCATRFGKSWSSSEFGSAVAPPYQVETRGNLSQGPPLHHIPVRLEQIFLRRSFVNAEALQPIHKGEFNDFMMLRG